MLIEVHKIDIKQVKKDEVKKNDFFFYLQHQADFERLNKSVIFVIHLFKGEKRTFCQDFLRYLKEKCESIKFFCSIIQESQDFFHCFIYV